MSVGGRTSPGPFLETVSDLRAGAAPLVTLELRRRFRRFSLKATAILSLGIGLLVGAFVLWIVISLHDGSWHNARLSLRSDALLFAAALQMIGVVLFVPVNAARAIVTEREAKTFEMLSITPMTSSTMIVQKGAFVVIQIAVLILGATAGLAIVYAVLGDILMLLAVAPVQLMVLLAAVLYCEIGLLFSCVSSNASTGITLAFAVILFVLPAIGCGMWTGHLLYFDLSPWGLIEPLTILLDPHQASHEDYLGTVITTTALPVAIVGLYYLCVLALEKRRRSSR